MKRKALRAAFPYTIPIMTGFLFLGFSYGLMMHAAGFPFVYPMLMALVIFAGSVEFVTVGMLQSAFHPLQAALVALMLNARHIFYGISMLDRYRGMGLKKIYLIYGMCDESFSINYTADIPPDVDPGWFMVFVNLLDQCYWVFGATMGGLLGSLIRLDMKGLDFVMTAMFVVIFLDNYLKEKDHVSSWLGIVLALLCLTVFGADDFMIPTMLMIVAALTALRGPLERRLQEEDMP